MSDLRTWFKAAAIDVQVHPGGLAQRGGTKAAQEDRHSNAVATAAGAVDALGNASGGGKTVAIASNAFAPA